MSSAPLPDTQTLDDMQRLPAAHRRSVVLMLILAWLNAFNDNILKMLLVGLAPIVAKGALGTDIGAWLGVMILLPYVLVAPLAGYLADRFSKRTVIIISLFMQSAILLLSGTCFHTAMGELSIQLALASFSLLALQATIFSPAKMGIMKELGGSRRLGSLAAWLQMMTLMGILSGLWLGGKWFDALYSQHRDPWRAAAYPIWVLFGISVAAIVAGFLLVRTPSHPSVIYSRSLLWQHFGHLRDSLHSAGMRRAFLGNAVYWFVGSMVTVMFVDIGLILYPDRASGGAASSASNMTLMVGIGTALGSIMVSWVSRRGLQLGIVPLGALGFALALFWSAFAPMGGTVYHFALIVVGFMAGCYMVPLQAYIQDRADPLKRGRVLSAMNLLDSVAGVAGVLFLLGLKYSGVGPAWQFITLGLLMLVATFYTLKILPQDLLYFVVGSVVRSLYRLRIRHAERVPKTGGVLLLPNHVSYVDAVIIGAASGRRVRFVMWDVLYQVRWMNWFLRLVGTVPISGTRAKDAIRTVANALKEGDLVCLFPEGQITRHGMINELRKGFELMVRQSGAPVVPMHLDGLYGSMFSYEGGTCFTKWPKKLRYPATVGFGTPLSGDEVSTAAVRQQIQDLNVEAFLTRPSLTQGASKESPLHQQALANAARLADIEWLLPGDQVLSLGDESHPMVQTLVAWTSLKKDVRHIHGLETWEKQTTSGTRTFAFGTEADLETLANSDRWKREGTAGCCWQAGLSEPNRIALEARITKPVYPGWLDPHTSALVTVSIPHPRMPEEEKHAQLGHKPTTQGRLLPGLSTRQEADALQISGLCPGNQEVVTIPSAELSAEGFVVFITPKPVPNEVAPPQG